MRDDILTYLHVHCMSQQGTSHYLFTDFFIVEWNTIAIASSSDNIARRRLRPKLSRYPKNSPRRSCVPSHALSTLFPPSLGIHETEYLYKTADCAAPTTQAPPAPASG